MYINNEASQIEKSGWRWAWNGWETILSKVFLIGFLSKVLTRYILMIIQMGVSWIMEFVLGSLVCEGMGPIFLEPKLVIIKKQKQKQKEIEEKRKTERREKKKEKHISLPRFHQIIDLASFVVRSSWNLEERFETRVATIWTVKIKFWARKLVLLPMNSNDMFFGILYPIFFVFSKRDYIIEGYMCCWCIW